MVYFRNLYTRSKLNERVDFEDVQTCIPTYLPSFYRDLPC